MCVLSCVQLFVTLWALALQASLSMEFSWQVYWSGLPFPSPGNLPNPGIKSTSPERQTDSLLSDPPGEPFLKVDYRLKIALCMCQSQIFTTKLSVLLNAWLSAVSAIPIEPSPTCFLGNSMME